MGKSEDESTVKSLLDLPASAEPPLTPEESVEVLAWMVKSGARSMSAAFEWERQFHQELAELTFAAAPVSKLTGKAWVRIAYERRATELGVMSITAAGRALAKESETALDCAKPLSPGHCTNILRGLGVWPKKPRRSP